MEKERKEEEKKKEEGGREEEEDPGLELWFGTSPLFGTLVFAWNLFVWICWLGNPHSSLFAYVWGFKNPISV